MAVIALVGMILFMLLAFGLRAWVHYQRTGTTGFVGLSGRFGTLEWIGGVLFVAALIAGFAAPVLQLAGALEPSPAFESAAVHAIGLALFAVGVTATLWAQFAMGNSWRVGVDTTERTTLVAHGPFRWVRNPIFTAMVTATLGLCLLVPNVVSLFSLLALLLGLELHVRHVEEPYLTSVHGGDYLRYASATGRFLPGIGRLRTSLRS